MFDDEEKIDHPVLHQFSHLNSAAQICGFLCRNSRIKGLPSWRQLRVVYGDVHRKMGGFFMHGWMMVDQADFMENPVYDLHHK